MVCCELWAGMSRMPQPVVLRNLTVQQTSLSWYHVAVLCRSETWALQQNLSKSHGTLWTPCRQNCSGKCFTMSSSCPVQPARLSIMTGMPPARRCAYAGQRKHTTLSNQRTSRSSWLNCRSDRTWMPVAAPPDPLLPQPFRPSRPWIQETGRAFATWMR